MAHAVMPRLLEVRSTDVGSAEDRPPCDTTRKLETVLSDVPCFRIGASKFNRPQYLRHQNHDPPPTLPLLHVHCSSQDWSVSFSLGKTQACAPISSTCPRHMVIPSLRYASAFCELSVLAAETARSDQAGELRWFLRQRVNRCFRNAIIVSNRRRRCF